MSGQAPSEEPGLERAGGWTKILAASRLECDLAAAVLESQGVEVLSPGGSAEYAGAVFETSEIWVRTEVAGRALEILRTARGGA